ncbi:hypothetical protein IQ241_24275 [Romeria aff. gracilis LEGE 07310]|uniref:Uncharacterized protein n=1 Tax=Vasconcelosia minhoensis LEGE 07310 TaxID=915328 RepID=A0A8J7B118_9CYAN|nr:hypothetical protein [Romeria gracilis]MBE9080367.1 hypothetical protein [Romeria aff. gracilis LEGE 07310]
MKTLFALTCSCLLPFSLSSPALAQLGGFECYRTESGVYGINNCSNFSYEERLSEYVLWRFSGFRQSRDNIAFATYPQPYDTQADGTRYYQVYAVFAEGNRYDTQGVCRANQSFSDVTCRVNQITYRSRYIIN